MLQSSIKTSNSSAISIPLLRDRLAIEEALPAQVLTYMLSQNLRSQFNTLSAIEQRRLIDYFIQANITRKMPFIESISNKGLMKVRFI